MSHGPSRSRTLLAAAGRGAVAGLVGVAVMTAAEKAEQAVTSRPDSYVPARTLLALLGRRTSEADQPWLWNHAMHWGTGAAVGALRGVWSSVGLRGPRADLTHTVVRLAVDQTLENTTGVGRPAAHLAAARAGLGHRAQGDLLVRHWGGGGPHDRAVAALHARHDQPLTVRAPCAGDAARLQLLDR